jgi:hypothetical protein
MISDPFPFDPDYAGTDADHIAVVPVYTFPADASQSDHHETLPCAAPAPGDAGTGEITP